MADTFEIPDKAFDQHAIALGKTRSGKSSAMRLLVERQLDRGRRVCIIDPKGDWYGLRSSGTGKSAGYPVVIFGGEHADVPLNQHAGTHVAELVATGNRPCIIDLGGWHVAERTRFYIDFASTLFRTSKAPMQLVIDEVHNFAPQGKIMDPDAGKMIHWSNRLASEGQGKGIILLAASQRPQKVHKDFVTSCETLLAFRVIHPLDRNAIKEWIDGCPDREKGREVLESLATMQRGEAWVWSPEIGFGPQRVKFPKFSTFDSFAAPTSGESIKLKGWADIDLDEVKTKLQSVVEEAKANDPKELRRKIVDLEKQLAAKPASVAPTIKEVPVVSAADVKRVETVTDRIEAEGKMRIAEAEKLAASGRELVDTARQFAAALGKAKEPVRGGAEKYSKPIASIGKQFRPQPAKSTIISKAPARASAASSDDVQIGKCERAILGVLSQFPEGCEGGKLALLSGYRWSGGFRNSLSVLRTAGMIEGDNGQTMRITEAGEAAGPFDPLPQGKKLVKYWVENRHFGQCERKILAALIETPDGMTADELCAATGYEFSGGFRNSLSVLRTAGVIVGKNTGTMQASEELLQAAAT